MKERKEKAYDADGGMQAITVKGFPADMSTNKHKQKTWLLYLLDVFAMEKERSKRSRD